jgi:hypothetical protein
MLGKIKIFNIASLDLKNENDLDEGIELLKGVKLKLKGK